MCPQHEPAWGSLSRAHWDGYGLFFPLLLPDYDCVPSLDTVLPEGQGRLGTTTHTCMPEYLSFCIDAASIEFLPLSGTMVLQSAWLCSAQHFRTEETFVGIGLRSSFNTISVYFNAFKNTIAWDVFCSTSINKHECSPFMSQQIKVLWHMKLFDIHWIFHKSFLNLHCNTDGHYLPLMQGIMALCWMAEGFSNP